MALFMCPCVLNVWLTHVMVPVWRSEDNYKEHIPSPLDGSQRLNSGCEFGDEYHYQLS